MYSKKLYFVIKHKANLTKVGQALKKVWSCQKNQIQSHSTGCSLSDQHILSPVNQAYNDWFLLNMQRFPYMVLTFKTQALQVLEVLNFRSICGNLHESDKISCRMLG